MPQHGSSSFVSKRAIFPLHLAEGGYSWDDKTLTNISQQSSPKPLAKVLVSFERD
jgi:hypothetical protein